MGGSEKVQNYADIIFGWSLVPSEVQHYTVAETKARFSQVGIFLHIKFTSLRIFLYKNLEIKKTKSAILYNVSLFIFLPTFEAQKRFL